MPPKGQIVTIEWFYRRLPTGDPDPSSRDTMTGFYRGRNADDDDVVTGPDGRTYSGRLVEEQDNPQCPTTTGSQTK